jgi:hypothetical protein
MLRPHGTNQGVSCSEYFFRSLKHRRTRRFRLDRKGSKAVIEVSGCNQLQKLDYLDYRYSKVHSSLSPLDCSSMAIAIDVYFITNVEFSKHLTLKYPDKTRTDIVISGDETDFKVRCVLIGAHS